MAEKGKGNLVVLKEIDEEQISSYCERRTSEALDLLHNVASKSTQSSKLDPGIITSIKNLKNALPEPHWDLLWMPIVSPVWDVSAAEELKRLGLNQEQIRAFIGNDGNKLKNELVPRILFALKVLDYDDETFERFVNIIKICPSVGIMVCEILFNNDLMSKAQPFLDKDSFDGKKEIIVQFLKKLLGYYPSLPIIHLTASCGELIKSIVPDEMSIDVSWKKLSMYDMTAIVEVVSNTSVIKMVNLTGCHLNSETVSVLRDGLSKTNIEIHHLDVSWNAETDAKGWRIIGDIVKNNKVQQLDLSDCGLTYNKLDAFNKSLKDCEIKSLTLNLQEDVLPVLCELSLKVTETLRIKYYVIDSFVVLRDFIHFHHTKNLEIETDRPTDRPIETDFFAFDAKQKSKEFMKQVRRWRKREQRWWRPQLVDDSLTQSESRWRLQLLDSVTQADKNVSGIFAIRNGRLILNPVMSRVEFYKKKFPQLHWNVPLDLSSSDDSGDDSDSNSDEFGPFSVTSSGGGKAFVGEDSEMSKDFKMKTKMEMPSQLKRESAEPGIGSSVQSDVGSQYFHVNELAKELLQVVDDDATTVNNDLIEFCEKVLESGSKLPTVIKSNMISLNNCFGIAILAKQSDDDVLLHKVDDYITDDVNKITESDSFKHLSVFNLKKYLAICDLPDTVKLKLIEASFQNTVDIEAADDQNLQTLDFELIKIAAALSTKHRNNCQSLTQYCHRVLKHRLSDWNCLETAIFAENCQLYELKVWAEHHVIVNFASVFAKTGSDQELTMFNEISSIPDELRNLLIDRVEPTYEQSKLEEMGYKWLSTQLRKLSSFRTQTVGVEGGTIHLDGCSVTFPEGVLAEDTDITMSVNTDDDSWRDDGMAITPILCIEPSLSFDDSVVTVTMQTCCRVSAGESVTVKLLTNRGTGWEEEREIELGSNYEISFTVSHFSGMIAWLKETIYGIYRLNNDIFIQKKTGIISSHFFRFDKDQNDIMKIMKERKCSSFSTRTLSVEGGGNDQIKVRVDLTEPTPMDLSGECWKPELVEIQDVFKNKHRGEVSLNTNPSIFDASFRRCTSISGVYEVFVGSNLVDSSHVAQEWSPEPYEGSHGMVVRVDGTVQNLITGRQDNHNKDCDSTMSIKQEPRS